MKQTDLMKDECCYVWYDSELNALGANWQGYPTNEQVRRSCNFMRKFIRENNIRLHYSNQLNLKVLNKQAQDYLVSDWLPSVEELGLERIAVLASFDPYVKASMNKVYRNYLGNENLEIFVFGLEKHCLNWLKILRNPIDENQQLVNKISAFQMLKVDEEVKKLDPLEIDDYLSLIPQYNEGGKVDDLISLLREKLPSPVQLESFNFYMALASMRDIGLFLGSIKRHGIEPIEAIPQLEYVLDELSAKTDLPPRDTLLHYTVWNPDGERMRLYTSTKDEVNLVQSVKDSFPALEGAIDHLIKLHHIPMDTPYFAEICIKAESCFKRVIDSIVFAHRTVSPEVFAKELRFYFDPIMFDNNEYIGPGAVELPMFVYDHLLWSSRIKNEEYVEFKTKYLPYNLSLIRDIYKFYEDKDSLVDTAIKKLETGTSEVEVNSAKALLRLSNAQKSFRVPHKKLAKESYSHQDESGPNKGSGGYSTDILQFIYELNIAKIDELKTAIKRSAYVDA